MQGTASYCTYIIIVIVIVVVIIIIIMSKMYQKQTYHPICLVNISDI